MSEAARTVAAVANVLRSADLLLELRGAEDAAVGGVTQDSRSVRPGDLFLAWKGTGADAHDFVADAVRQGASAAVVERPVDVDVPQLVVKSGRRAAALAADAVLGSPSRDMLVVGITGTNGKTTTSLLARHLLSADRKTAVIGTFGVVDDAGVRPGTEGLTTPGPVQVAVWLRDLADGGSAAVVMEASSHALEQHRLDGVAFGIGAFTNLTQDHLDYHGDMDAYRRSKAHLVELVVPDGTIVVNAEDPAWAGLDTAGRRRVSFGIDIDADVRASGLELGPAGTTFALHAEGRTFDARLPLVGRYNVQNALAALCIGRAAGLEFEALLAALAETPPVAGRLEAIVTEPFTVFVDFAHTPDALANALAAVKPLTRGRLISVFGAGGDRDPTKRRPMGEAVGAVADVVIVTSDNPRTEDPDAIIDDVVEGLVGVQYQRFADRREAIDAAIGMAEPGDAIVLTGKGHESYQVIGTEKLPFDEHAIVREAIRARGTA